VLEATYASLQVLWELVEKSMKPTQDDHHQEIVTEDMVKASFENLDSEGPEA
jgi:hypothetical protein